MAARSKREPAGCDASLRERILGAAFGCFMQNGYAGTSTLEIASRARISKRDLYAMFRSKQAMLTAVITERAERMRMPLHLPPPASVEALSATLVRFGATLMVELSRPEVLATFRLAITEAERSPGIARTLETVGRAETVKRLGELMQTAQQNGLIGAGDPVEMGVTFMALLWGGMHVRLLLRSIDPPTAAEAERHARAAADGVLRLYGR